MKSVPTRFQISWHVNKGKIHENHWLKKKSKNIFVAMVIVDETWVRHCDIKFKISGMQCHCPSSSVQPRTHKSAGKEVMIVFWDAKCVPLNHYLHSCNMINGQCIAGLLTKLKKSSDQKWWIAYTHWHQENASFHEAHLCS